MKFYGEPNMLVRQARKTGHFRHIKPFRFDSNGEYSTDNQHLIKTLSRRFKCELEASIEEQLSYDEFMTEDQIREMAKAKKIKSWHVKSIETLKEELGVYHGSSK